MNGEVIMGEVRMVRGHKGIILWKEGKIEFAEARARALLAERGQIFVLEKIDER